MAAHMSWATETNRTARTDAARQAFRDRFLHQVPAEIADPAERAKAAENLRKAFYTRLALKSAKSRRLRAQAAELDAEIADATSELDGGDAA
jgi:hypothetical protein